MPGVAKQSIFEKWSVVFWVLGKVVRCGLGTVPSGDHFWCPEEGPGHFRKYVASCGAQMSEKEAPRWLLHKTLGISRAILICKNQYKNDVAQNGSKGAPRHLLNFEGFSVVYNVAFDL